MRLGPFARSASWRPARRRPLAGALGRLSADRSARVLAAYELVEEVARGGMGIVYRARQPQNQPFGAVEGAGGGQFAAPDFVKRFRTEAEAAASLDHPNIVAHL